MPDRKAGEGKNPGKLILIKKLLIPFLFLIIILSGLNCSVYQSISNVSRLKFKIDSATEIHLAGVPLAGKHKLKDFNTIEALKISTSFIRGKLPLTFTLHINAKNPNDGTGGYPKTNATIKSFPWRLFIDNKETVTGNIDQPFVVPGIGESTQIPISISINLIKFFKDMGYDGIVNLALNLTGNGGRPTDLTLFAKPTVGTKYGDISYPNEVKIVSFQYSN